MKTLNEIYSSIVNRFKYKTNLDIAEGSVIDSYIVSTSGAIEDAHKEIENNKTPHIFTKLSGSDIDGMGMLVGCARHAGEKDENFLYRMLNWNTSNQASNEIAIEAALQNMEYASNAKYVPYTQGAGTGTTFIIPKKLDNETIEAAIAETKERLKNVVSKSSYIEYVVPTMLPVNIIVYVSILKDETNVKENISDKIEKYINNIKPGDKMEIGEINKIGINEPNVNYFSVSALIINNKEVQTLNVTQKLEEKLLFNQITWNMVVSE